MQHFTHGSLEISVVNLFQKMRKHLGVRFRKEFMPFFYQFFLKCKIVLNNAVMHDDKIPCAIRMRMRIQVGRTPVCCPARMPYSHCSNRDIASQFFFQFGKPADAFFHADIFTVENRDARRVVSPIFKLRQTFQKKLRRLAIAHISNNTAHTNSPPYLHGRIIAYKHSKEALLLC